MEVIGLVQLKTFGQDQTLSALFVIDVSIGSQLLCFQKHDAKNC